MSTLNIEVEGSKVFRLQTRRDGSVEVIVSEYWNLSDGGKSSGPPKDTEVAVIPKDRRQLVADFMNNL